MQTVTADPAPQTDGLCEVELLGALDLDQTVGDRLPGMKFILAHEIRDEGVAGGEDLRLVRRADSARSGPCSSPPPIWTW